MAGRLRTVVKLLELLYIFFYFTSYLGQNSSSKVKVQKYIFSLSMAH